MTKTSSHNPVMNWWSFQGASRQMSAGIGWMVTVYYWINRHQITDSGKMVGKYSIFQKEPTDKLWNEGRVCLLLTSYASEEGHDEHSHIILGRHEFSHSFLHPVVCGSPLLNIALGQTIHYVNKKQCIYETVQLALYTCPVTALTHQWCRSDLFLASFFFSDTLELKLSVE